MGNLITVKSKVPVDIVGIKIAFVRPMTKREHDFEGWKYDPKNRPYVIELENGVLLYPSQNNDGDAPGHYSVGIPRRKRTIRDSY